jgi:hypothetical protein
MPAGEGFLRVVASRTIKFKRGETVRLDALGIIRKAWEKRGATIDFYWARDRDPEDTYKDIIDRKREGGRHKDVNIQSELAMQLRFDSDLIAILDVESTKKAITERYQRIIHRACDYAAVLLRGMQLSRHSILDDIYDRAHEGKNDSFVLAQKLKLAAPHLLLDVKDIEKSFEKLEDLAKLKAVTQMSPVKLHDQVEKIRKLAERKEVTLDVTGTPERCVLGTDSKVESILKNLVHNTRFHSLRQVHKAWLTFTVEGNRCRMEYWDNFGGVHKEVDTAAFLDGKEGHSGVRHISRNATEMGWSVEVKRHPREKSYHYIFLFDLLPPE